MTHEITLSRYAALPAGLRSELKLGTAGSYGTEQLALHPKTDWEGLAVTVTFHPPGGGEPVRMLADKEGGLAVPPEATAAAGEGQIVFAGLAEGVQRISCDLPYRVEEHAAVEGAESAAAPTVLEQAVTAAAQSALEAQTAASAAADSAAAAAQSAQSTADVAQQAAEEIQAGAAAAAKSAAAAQESEVAAAQSQMAAAQSTQISADFAAAAAESAGEAAQSKTEAAASAERIAEAQAAAQASAEAAELSRNVAEASAAAAAESSEETGKMRDFVLQIVNSMDEWTEQAMQIVVETNANAVAAASSKEAADTSAVLASKSSTNAAISADRAQEAAVLAQQAALNPPQLSESLTWQVWNQTEGGYLDTGVFAVGPQGAQGPKGDPGNGIQLAGSYESYEKMIAAQPTPGQGNACTVNGELWVFTDGAWENAGQLQGVKGDPGQDGYTPIKGVDYWTEADRQQLVRQVLESLPNGDEVSY